MSQYETQRRLDELQTEISNAMRAEGITPEHMTEVAKLLEHTAACPILSTKQASALVYGASILVNWASQQRLSNNATT